MGSVTTGVHHPLRSGISQPSAPVPSSSNVRDGADQDARGERKSSEMKSDSHLKEEVASQPGGDPGNSEEARRE
ncbi:cAMP-regulated phospho family Igo1 [Fusarium albosuccineum]|uniref:cAMP-regulated phospho family Igo1 n=1 Tax=Fusarium albosuccineum TaxID=1237068 RepID=A0A8H4L717_9HYPO|nr:cAMP-regulated phospho family Igo1 [Fusarium albosuccineum]